MAAPTLMVVLEQYPAKRRAELEVRFLAGCHGCGRRLVHNGVLVYGTSLVEYGKAEMPLCSFCTVKARKPG